MIPSMPPSSQTPFSTIEVIVRQETYFHTKNLITAPYHEKLGLNWKKSTNEEKQTDLLFEVRFITPYDVLLSPLPLSSCAQGTALAPAKVARVFNSEQQQLVPDWLSGQTVIWSTGYEASRLFGQAVIWSAGYQVNRLSHKPVMWSAGYEVS